MQKVAYIFLIMLAGASLCWCIYRDIHIERQYTGDLRNRIAGARLQKDGISPYFYKWKSADGLRYYDPQNFDTLKVSNITATPFLHQLLYPIADFPQRKISRIWMVIEYILFFLIATISLSFVKKTIQQSAVITTASVFLYTTAWTGHIAAGQIYLLIPFLSLVFYYCIRKNEKILFAALAGVSAAMLVLIRPTAVLFLLP
ncbi:MAG: glycosyltransferase 87 family protein, partial [Bacteroidota bacterium]